MNVLQCIKDLHKKIMQPLMLIFTVFPLMFHKLYKIPGKRLLEVKLTELNFFF